MRGKHDENVDLNEIVDFSVDLSEIVDLKNYNNNYV